MRSSETPLADWLHVSGIAPFERFVERPLTAAANVTPLRAVASAFGQRENPQIRPIFRRNVYASRMRATLSGFCIVALWAAGCRPEAAAPNLLNVHDFAPREIEAGDRFEVLGSGFPEGKPAAVTFRGDLHRPGKAPERGVEITAAASSTAATKVSLLVSEELERRFCGFGDAAEHTTFRGTIETAFAPKIAGAPPITGVLGGVVLDVQPPAPAPEIALQRRREGERALDFVGLRIAGEPAADGLSIEAVASDGRADRAGVVAGDVLVELDGVSVRSVSDAVPSGRARFIEIALRRGKLRDLVVRRLDVQGLRPAAPEELLPPVAIIGFVCALLLLPLVPGARALVWVLRRTAATLRARGRAARPGALSALGAALSGFAGDVGRGGLVTTVAAWLGLVVASAWLALGAAGVYVLAPETDLPALLLASTTGLVAAALAWGGRRGAGRWSLRAGLASALGALGTQLPALAGTVAVFLTAGTTRLDDVVALQGGLPWQWNAFRSPPLFAALVLSLPSALAAAAQLPGELPEADLDSSGGEPGALVVALERCHAFVLCGAACSLFLGGGRIPGVAGAPGFAAAAVLLGKVWLLALAVLWLRWALPRLGPASLGRVAWLRLAPLSIAVVAAALGWTELAGSSLLAPAQPAIGWMLFAVASAVLAWSVARVLRSAHGAQPGLSPWL
jgi:NADH-quinone oxidoreductase subunit H